MFSIIYNCIDLKKKLQFEVFLNHRIKIKDIFQGIFLPLKVFKSKP